MYAFTQYIVLKSRAVSESKEVSDINQHVVSGLWFVILYCSYMST